LGPKGGGIFSAAKSSPKSRPGSKRFKAQPNRKKNPQPRKGRTMPSNDHVNILTFGRCTYLTKTGRRCRSTIVYPDGRYCRQHILTQASKDDFEMLLTDQALRFRNTRGIHNSLQRLYGLLASGEISPRRAATLAYISNLLIRHLPDPFEADSRHCRCNGYPHAPHAPYDPADEKSATATKPASRGSEKSGQKPVAENSAALTNPAAQTGSEQAATNPQLPPLRSISDMANSAKQPGSATLN
jgi:hypothetical protein